MNSRVIPKSYIKSLKEQKLKWKEIDIRSNKRTDVKITNLTGIKHYENDHTVIVLDGSSIIYMSTVQHSDISELTSIMQGAR